MQTYAKFRFNQQQRERRKKNVYLQLIEAAGFSTTATVCFCCHKQNALQFTVKVILTMKIFKLPVKVYGPSKHVCICSVQSLFYIKVISQNVILMNEKQNSTWTCRGLELCTKFEKICSLSDTSVQDRQCESRDAIYLFQCLHLSGNFNILLLKYQKQTFKVVKSCPNAQVSRS